MPKDSAGLNNRTFYPREDTYQYVIPVKEKQIRRYAGSDQKSAPPSDDYINQLLKAAEFLCKKKNLIHLAMTCPTQRDLYNNLVALWQLPEDDIKNLVLAIYPPAVMDNEHWSDPTYFNSLKFNNDTTTNQTDVGSIRNSRQTDSDQSLPNASTRSRPKAIKKRPKNVTQECFNFCDMELTKMLRLNREKTPALIAWAAKKFPSVIPPDRYAFKGKDADLILKPVIHYLLSLKQVFLHFAMLFPTDNQLVYTLVQILRYRGGDKHAIAAINSAFQKQTADGAYKRKLIVSPTSPTWEHKEHFAALSLYRSPNDSTPVTITPEDMALIDSFRERYANGQYSSIVNFHELFRLSTYSVRKLKIFCKEQTLTNIDSQPLISALIERMEIYLHYPDDINFLRIMYELYAKRPMPGDLETEIIARISATSWEEIKAEVNSASFKQPVSSTSKRAVKGSKQDKPQTPKHSLVSWQEMREVMDSMTSTPPANVVDDDLRQAKQPTAKNQTSYKNWEAQMSEPKVQAFKTKFVDTVVRKNISLVPERIPSILKLAGVNLETTPWESVTSYNKHQIRRDIICYLVTRKNVFMHLAMLCHTDVKLILFLQSLIRLSTGNHMAGAVNSCFKLKNESGKLLRLDPTHGDWSETSKLGRYALFQTPGDETKITLTETELGKIQQYRDMYCDTQYNSLASMQSLFNLLTYSADQLANYCRQSYRQYQLKDAQSLTLALIERVEIFMHYPDDPDFLCLMYELYIREPMPSKPREAINARIHQATWPEIKESALKILDAGTPEQVAFGNIKN